MAAIKTPPNGAPDIFPFIPMLTGQLTLAIDDYNWTSGSIPANNIQVFTKNGVHIAGTAIGKSGGSWAASGISNVDDLSNIMTEANGFNPGAKYQGNVNDTGADLPQGQYKDVDYNGMVFHFLGESDTYTGVDYGHSFHVDSVTEDLIIMVTGQRTYDQLVALEFMPDQGFGAQTLVIQTQEDAQRALPRIDGAIVRKDQIRAHLGATQNRLENTISNLQIQAENMQAAESRISDADVAVEMSEFVRTQILAQAATAMLAQTNNLPGSIAMALISG
jgi:flagellin